MFDDLIPAKTPTPKAAAPKAAAPKVAAPKAAAPKAAVPSAKPTPTPQYETSPLGVAARGALRSVLPTLVGVGTGAATGAALGLETGPGAFVTGLGGAIVGGVTASKAQEEYWKQHPNVARFMGQSPEQQAADIAAHKYVARGSEYVPGFLTGRPFTSAAPLKAGANIVQRGLASVAGRNAASGVIGGGFETARETVMGEKLDPKAIAIAAAAAAAQGRGWRTPKVDTPLERQTRRTAPYRKTEVPSSPDEGVLRAAGIKPTPLDIMPEKQQQVVRDASVATPESRASAANYAVEVPGALPKEGAPIAEQLTPGDTRTRRQAEEEVASERTGAQQNVYGAPVRPGEATGDFARQAAQEREANRLKVDETFDVARAKGNVDLEVLDPNDPNSGWTNPTDAQVKEFGIKEPSVINTKTSEVRPTKDAGPLGVAEIAAEMRTGTGSLARTRPGDVAGTLSVIEEVASKPYPTGEDFLGWRKSLTDLADSYRGQPEGNAARKARNALDAQIDALDAADRFLGDPDFIKAWRAGYAERRAFGTKWEGGSVMETITEPRYVDGKWTTAVDPEVAANAIAGSGQQKGKIISNLNTVRDHVGEGSPMWASIRRELLQRQMGFNPDDPNNVKKLTDWARKNPDVADILMTPADSAAISSAESTIAGASGREGALKLGKSLFSTDTVLADVTDAIGSMSNAQLRDARVAARQALRGAFDTPQASADILSRVNSSPDVQAKLRALFGPEAEGLLSTAGALVRRYKLAESMMPPRIKGETTAADVAAEATRAAARSNPMGAVAVLTAWLARTYRGISGDEAESLVRDALDPTKTEAVKEFIRQRYGENAVTSIMGRIRSGLQHVEPGMRVIRRGVVPLANPDTTVTEKKEAAAPAEEGGPAPVSNRGMFDDLIPSSQTSAPEGEVPPPPPTAEDEARASQRVSPPETVSFVSSLSPQQAKALAIVAEASKNIAEMRGVGHVLENRGKNPKRYGKDVYSILTGGEFDAFNTAPEHLRELMASDRFKRAMAIVSNIEAGKDPDPTKGATHFIAPELMKQKGYRQPKWGKAGGLRLGSSVFYSPAG
jgi:hypothetical protein